MRTRAAVLFAAMESFAERGHPRTSIADVAERVGMTPQEWEDPPGGHPQTLPYLWWLARRARRGEDPDRRRAER